MTKQIRRIYRSAESGHLVAYDSSQPPGHQIRIAWRENLILATSIDNARALQQLLSDVLALLDSKQSQSADSMTDIRKADASDWAWLEGNSTVNRCDAAWSRGLIELRARVEALEAQQQPQDKLDRLIAQDRAASEARPDGLVERVVQAMINSPPTPGDWKPEARAAILAVAAWLRTGRLLHAAELLEQEVDRG
jgi:hypothetical protein